VGRYLWFRNNAAVNWLCPLTAEGPQFSSPECVAPEFARLTIAEIAAYANRCPSLGNWVDNATSSLVSLAGDGCGAVGPLNASAVVEGSECKQVFMGARQRGGFDGSVTTQLRLRCALGEWVQNSTGLAVGPAVVGAVCPPLAPPVWVDANTCVHIVINANFTGKTGTAMDWYPTWRVFKVSSAAPLPLSAMEYRAVVEDGVLTLSGQQTLFGLNEPRWANISTGAQLTTVAVDVRAGGSGYSDVGIALRIQPGIEPASFYLMRIGGGGRNHSLVRVVAGVETTLVTVPAAACNLSTTGFTRLWFMAGAKLSAYCVSKHVAFMQVTDASADALPPLGSVGLYHDNPFNAVNASAAFNSLLAMRPCVAGVCRQVLPGETCNWGCAFAPAGWSAILKCQTDGTWSTRAQCLPATREFFLSVLAVFVGHRAARAGARPWRAPARRTVCLRSRAYSVPVSAHSWPMSFYCPSSVLHRPPPASAHAPAIAEPVTAPTNTAALRCSGNASVSAGQAVLTPAKASQAGACWLMTTTDPRWWDVSFDFAIST
jgi:hypothetical protein